MKAKPIMNGYLAAKSGLQAEFQLTYNFELKLLFNASTAVATTVCNEREHKRNLFNTTSRPFKIGF